MTTLLDLNVLVALLDPGHVHHEAAHAWWSRSRRQGWATCAITQNGFVRISSQRSYPNRVNPAEAVAAVEEASSDGNHEFWQQDVSLGDTTLFRRNRILGPKQVTDVYLLGLAVRRKARLATFDRRISISAVIGADKDNLVFI